MKRTILLVASVAMAAGLWLGLSSETKPAAEAAPAVAKVNSSARPSATQRPMIQPREIYQTDAELAYAVAFASGKTPGIAAFRVSIDAYVDLNFDEALEKARAEGLTVDEVRELTYFGFMVLRSQHWNDVQELLGRELTAEQKSKASDLMESSNGEFKLKMRELVARGASEAERWELIRATQDDYLREYFAVTGASEDVFDQLLAGAYGSQDSTSSPTSVDQADSLLANAGDPTPEGIGAQDDGE